MPDAPSTSRQEERTAATRQRILEAATRLMMEEGESGFSMRKLAARVGYTPTAIYFHFPDRQSLLGEVVDHQFIALRAVFEQAAREPDPVRRIGRMGAAFTDFGLAHPDHYRFMFLGSSFPGIPKGQLIEKGNPAQDCYACLRHAVTEAIAAGCFRPEMKDAEEVAQLFFASVHGVVALHIVKSDDDWVDWRPVRPRALRMIAALIRGLTIDQLDLTAMLARLKPAAPPRERRERRGEPS